MGYFKTIQEELLELQHRRHIDPSTGEPFPLECPACGQVWEPKTFRPLPWDQVCPDCEAIGKVAP